MIKNTIKIWWKMRLTFYIVCHIDKYRWNEQRSIFKIHSSNISGVRLSRMSQLSGVYRFFQNHSLERKQAYWNIFFFHFTKSTNRFMTEILKRFTLQAISCIVQANNQSKTKWKNYSFMCSEISHHTDMLTFVIS